MKSRKGQRDMDVEPSREPAQQEMNITSWRPNKTFEKTLSDVVGAKEGRGAHCGDCTIMFIPSVCLIGAQLMLLEEWSSGASNYQCQYHIIVADSP